MDEGNRENVSGTVEWSADELIPFGKYILLDRISGGATAAVYRANIRGEAGFERLVAIKRILPHMAGDRAFIETFVREAKIVARMTHAGICPIYELGKVGESLYMAVEYVQGKDLGQILRRLDKRDTAMPPTITAWISARLCEALDYAHAMKNAKGDSAGIVHRDLSPSNVLVSYEGQVKLIDFGLAKAVGRAQATNVDALKQKLSYMSPEMVKGRPVDARSDIFGLGVCLYEMLTGKRLFSGANDVETLKMVARASVPPPSAVIEDPPDELEMIVMRALEREPHHRFQTCGEMAAALDTYLHGAEPDFGTQTLSHWMHELFADEIESEQARVKQLLTASADPQLIQRRRAFFASSAGAAARARAELERRLSTDLPPARDKLHPQVPKAAKVPAEALVPPPPLGFEQETTDFYDPEKTQAAPLDLAGQIFGEGAGSNFDDEKTVAAPLAAGEAFEEEPTRLVDGGFEEEPTTVFFNKEEGIGMQTVMQDIDAPAGGPGGLNLPILDPELEAVESSIPPALDLPVPNPVPLPPLPPMPYAQAPGTERARLISGARTIESRAVPKQPGTLAVTAGAVLLLLAIVGLIFRTPAGVALGLRAPSKGAIEVHTTPAGAEVKLDGVYHGQAPLRMQGVRSGPRRLDIRVAGFLPMTKDVEVIGGETAHVMVDLVPAAAPAPRAAAAAVPPVAPPPVVSAPRAPPSGTSAETRRAEPHPQPARGAELAPAPNLEPDEVTPAAAATPERASAAPPPARTRPAPAESEPETEVEPESEQPAPGPATPSAPRSPATKGGLGTLVVYTVPWSIVFIDGRDTGRTTPLVAYPLSAGSHELRLQAATGQVHEQRIEVVAGQTVRVTRRF